MAEIESKKQHNDQCSADENGMHKRGRWRTCPPSKCIFSPRHVATRYQQVAKRMELPPHQVDGATHYKREKGYERWDFLETTNRGRQFQERKRGKPLRQGSFLAFPIPHPSADNLRFKNGSESRTGSRITLQGASERITLFLPSISPTVNRQNSYTIRSLDEPELVERMRAFSEGSAAPVVRSSHIERVSGSG